MDKSCSLRQLDSIDLIVGEEERASNNLLVRREYYVPVTIDGRYGVMRLALSSGFSSFDEGALNSLALKTAPLLGVLVADGREKWTHFGMFKSFKLGNVPFGRGKFLIDPNEPQKHEPGGRPVFGALGTDALTVLDFELDLSRRKLNLFSHDHCKGKVVYWAKEWGSARLHISGTGSLYFPLELEGRMIESTFAPHLALSALKTDVAESVYGFDERSPGIQSVPYEDDTLAHFRAMQITGQGMSFLNTPVRLDDGNRRTDRVRCEILRQKWASRAIGYDCGNAFPMAIGGNVLEKMRIYFATKEKRLYFTLADGTLGASPSAQPTKSAEPAGSE